MLAYIPAPWILWGMAGWILKTQHISGNSRVFHTNSRSFQDSDHISVFRFNLATGKLEFTGNECPRAPLGARSQLIWWMMVDSSSHWKLFLNHETHHETTTNIFENLQIGEWNKTGSYLEMKQLYGIFMRVCLKMSCTPLYPMVLLIIIPMKNGYFIGNINPTFSDKHIS